MARKYAVGLSSLTPEQQKELIAFFKESRVAWWHWIPGMWLIVDRRRQLSPKAIRDKLREIAPSARSMVIEVKGKNSWAGSGPKLDEKNMFSWIRETWNKYDDGSGRDS